MTDRHQRREDNSGPKVKKRLSGEDIVVISVSLFTLGASLPLYIYHFPHTLLAIFLAMGVTSWVYKVLGGIQGAAFRAGVFRVGGSLAALMGVAYWVDGRLENFMKYLDAQKMAAERFHLVSSDLIVGEWKWEATGASASWTGHLDFKKENDQFVFSGEEFNWEKKPGGADQRTLLFRLSNGKATLTNGNSLTLESDVESLARDHRYHPKWHWKSVAPFALVPAFSGDLRPENPSDGTTWGMLIVKQTARGGN